MSKTVPWSVQIHFLVWDRLQGLAARIRHFLVAFDMAEITFTKQNEALFSAA
jgi:hypothetical protein